MLQVTFGDEATTTVANVLNRLETYTVNLKWAEGITPACANPVCIVQADDADASLIVCEADETGGPIRNATYYCYFDDIEEVHVL